MNFDDYIKENIQEENLPQDNSLKNDFSWLNLRVRKTKKLNTEKLETEYDSSHCNWLKYTLENPVDSSAGDWSN